MFRYLVMTFACLSLLVTAAPAQEDKLDSAAESLFDGATLDGWRGDTNFWSVEDGAITGISTAERPLPHNSFLIWDGELGDFELTLKFKIAAGNSGIQYRSQDLGEFRVGGYQADIDADHRFIGILYDERGRGILASRAEKVEISADGQRSVVGETCDEAELLSNIKSGEWNEYHIVANGSRLIQKINGYVTVDVDDRDKENSDHAGVLALQLHAGPPMKVQFKDIQLRRLDSSHD